jgi:hypothetical protein
MLTALRQERLVIQSPPIERLLLAANAIVWIGATFHTASVLG